LDRTIIVHIGFPETGTNWLQNALFSAKPKDLNVRLVPATVSSTSNRDLAHAVFGTDHAWSLLDTDQHEEVIETYRMTIKRMLERDDSRPIFISSEELCRLDEFFTIHTIEKLRHAFGNQSICVIALKREPLDFLASRYSHETLMGGEVRPMEQFVRDEALTAQFERRLLCWKALDFVSEVVEIDYAEDFDSIGLIEKTIGPFRVDGNPLAPPYWLQEMARNRFR
jgi:hypothetical protein